MLPLHNSRTLSIGADCADWYSGSGRTRNGKLLPAGKRKETCWKSDRKSSTDGNSLQIVAFGVVVVLVEICIIRGPTSQASETGLSWNSKMHSLHWSKAIRASSCPELMNSCWQVLTPFLQWSHHCNWNTPNPKISKDNPERICSLIKQADDKGPLSFITSIKIKID